MVVWFHESIVVGGMDEKEEEVEGYVIVVFRCVCRSGSGIVI